MSGPGIPAVFGAPVFVAVGSFRSFVFRGWKRMITIKIENFVIIEGNQGTNG
jgi:hypothetical protein